MKIGIDTFGCVHGRSGMGSFLLSLIPVLNRHKDLQLELFGPEIDRFTFLSNESIDYKSVNVPDSLTAERFWHKFSANRFAKKSGYSAVIYAAGSRLLPSRFKVPGVALVNDFMSLKHKDGRYEKGLIKSLDRCSCIIASSEAVKQDLIQQGVKNTEIYVVHSGIDHSLFYPREGIVNESDILEIKPFAIKRPYIIYAGSMNGPEKKHVELIKAFTMFKERTGLPHRLVIAGTEGPYAENVHKEAFASSAASDIFITGFFPHESFAQLYRYAEACIVPSIDDGSGLSVLEAMATGVPVACSSKGALPEVSGNNLIYFDSDDIEQISKVLERLVTNDGLRADLTAKSLEWTGNFNWENTAFEIAKIIRKHAVSER